jgi:hypothetical protein
MATFAMVYSTGNSMRIVGIVTKAPDAISALDQFCTRNGLQRSNDTTGLSAAATRLRGKGKHSILFTSIRPAAPTDIRPDVIGYQKMPILSVNCGLGRDTVKPMPGGSNQLLPNAIMDHDSEDGQPEQEFSMYIEYKVIGTARVQATSWQEAKRKWNECEVEHLIDDEEWLENIVATVSGPDGKQHFEAAGTFEIIGKPDVNGVCPKCGEPSGWPVDGSMIRCRICKHTWDYTQRAE